MDTEGSEIVVTSEMIDAGLDELRDHTYGEDLRLLLEAVFRAMAYKCSFASAIKADR
jgi:hypothetical protein